MSAPSVPPAEVIETPPPPETEPVPPPAQEPPPDTDEESGAPEAEDEGSGSPAATLLELVKEHPELLTDDVKKELGIRDELPPDEDINERETAVEETRWTQPLAKASELASSYNTQNLQASAAGAVSGYLDEVEAAIKKAAESGEAVETPSAERMFGALIGLVQANGGVWADFNDKLAKAKAFESSKPYLKYLNAAEKKALREAQQKNLAEFHAAFTPIIAGALLRAAPDEVVTKRVAEKTKELGLTEKLAKLQEGLGRNGRKARTDLGGGTSNSYNTKMEARTLHVQGKLTNAEMRRINADPSIPEM